ncbi:anaphase-promoting complex subunit cdc27 [Gamsiella multidivaricata]|nr:anaphase-promoting complex subunit cdc27 [Gamsiella multidivaricata]
MSAQKRPKLAIKYFKEVLELNPFSWEAFENLCELGAPQDPNNMFAQFDIRLTSMLPKSIPTFQRSRTITVDSPFFSTKRDMMQDENVESALSDSSNILNNSLLRYEPTDSTKTKSTFLPPMLSTSVSAMAQTNGLSFMEPDGYNIEKTPTPLGASANRELPFAIPTALADSSDRVPLRRGATSQPRRHFERTKSNSTLQGQSTSGGITKRGLGRSTSVSNFSASALLRGSSSRNQPKGAPSLMPKKDAANDDREQQRDAAPATIPLPITEAELWVEEEGLRTVADIFRIMARAYGLLSLNKFTESITEFERLPFEHLQSGWVQCQLAKCKFEMQDYTSAARYFERARELEPSLQRDMEIFSSCLWQLRKEMTLSTLAKELKDANHQSPQAWVALGNAYSLKHESDHALKCFQRAIQLNDKFAYAHTLSGHEYTELEEYDKAQAEFRAAMSIDPRHYHAWYGMGLIYNRMGKNDLALIHVREAHRLNPTNSVLLYLVGSIQEKMSRTTEALRSFEEAINLDPNNVAARFRKAHVQMEMEQCEEALRELEAIKKLSPDEANVFVLQGRVLLKMGDKTQALKYFTWALNLDSKSSHAIRDLIEKVDQGSDGDQGSYEVKVDMD